MIKSTVGSTSFLLKLPRATKIFIALFVDVGLCIFTVWFAFYLRLGEFVTLSGESVWAVVMAIALALPIFIQLGLYRTILRYSGWPALILVARAVGIYGLSFAALFTAWGVNGVPRTIGLIQPLLLLIAIGGSRTAARYWLGGLDRATKTELNAQRVLIYGAGSAGRQLASAIFNSKEMRVVGYVDDDETLHHRNLNGLTIWSPKNLEVIVDRFEVTDVLLAMPSVSRQRRNEILNEIQKCKVAVRTLPSVTELLQGKVTASDLRDLDIDDLLGRVSVVPDQLLLTKKITDQVVMVTGAGGSIGSELVRQIVKLRPKVLLLIDQSEFALYQIDHELEAILLDGDTKVISLIASVQDEPLMNRIMSTWKPSIVYHAAAYKHVPLVEHNPCEGIKNNVFGTLVTARAAAANAVRDFVLISTDKAVRPTNIMGASKRVAELILQALSSEAAVQSSTAGTKAMTAFSMVRFGNVLGSSGSVVPLFRQQIRIGGPITVTHPEITRYFMTIPEAAQLVIQAGAMATGGEVFVLNMGDPVKIIDLAYRMVQLSGLTVRDHQNPDGDLEISLIGLRPGEKLYEELLIGADPNGTHHPRIMKANEKSYPWSVLTAYLDQLEAALANQDVGSAKKVLEHLVEGYSSSSKTVDWITGAKDLNVV